MNTVKQIKLAPRQSEALNLIAKGYTQQEAAELMGCSRSNVKHLICECWFKLKVMGRSDGLVKATRLGLIRFSFMMFTALFSSLFTVDDEEFKPRNPRRALIEFRIKNKEVFA